MVLLPAISRDAISTVLRALFEAEPTVAHYLLSAATLAVLGLPLVGFVFLLRDLTRFYFHGHHFATDSGQIFVPRFTLTGLRLPADELSEASRATLVAARRTPATVELLVPANDGARGARSTASSTLMAGSIATQRPAISVVPKASSRSVAARDRLLAEEVAKVEHGIARHILRSQVIILRYVKALLMFFVTTLAVFAAAGAVGSDTDIGATTEVWLGVIYLAWAVGVVLAVGDPVRTIEALLRSEGATRTALRADLELTRVERIAVQVAAGSFVLSLLSLVATVVDERPDGRVLGFAIGGGVVLTAAFVASLTVWLRRMRRA